MLSLLLEAALRSLLLGAIVWFGLKLLRIRDPRAHMITRWLGADAPDLAPGITTFAPTHPGRVVVCSDGLWNYTPAAHELAALTESGSTALWMSRLNCGVPIYALTSQTVTRYRCALFRDTYPLMVKYVGHDREELLAEAENVLVRNGVVQQGDLIVITIGEPIGKAPT